MKNNYIIYKAQNLENGLVYIGATTKGIDVRRKDHIKKSNSENRNEFQEAISTYGAEAFIWEEIDTATSADELAQVEQKYIYEYNSKKEGYNESIGGEFQKTVYQYSIDDGSLVEKYDCLENASNAVNANKQQMSKVCLSVNKYYRGFYWSYVYNEPFELTIDERKKKVGQFREDGVHLKTFNSVSEANKHTQINKTSIAKVCRGERKFAGGFYWKYI